ncbi:hypothetical protein X777_06040 [Ooceraea biroi]|uniref:Uncharacterized protein n=1 Tax=Ooceraea biroi TaxID=2015173 RepID=A0A026WDM2_OOCBI|nr:hypothetical protein X777_06040 [Ooceraea biroi]
MTGSAHNPGLKAGPVPPSSAGRMSVGKYSWRINKEQLLYIGYLTLFRVFSSRNGFTRARVAWTYNGAERKCIALNRAGNRPRKAVIRFRRAAAPSAPP